MCGQDHFKLSPLGLVQNHLSLITMVHSRDGERRGRGRERERERGREREKECKYTCIQIHVV